MQKRLILWVLAVLGILPCSNGLALRSFPDTGQNLCYDNLQVIPCPLKGQPFYGQDAQFAGTPPSYSKLGRGGVALPDSAKSFAENGPWMMTRDNVTGLIWEIKTIANSTDTYTWLDAQNTFITSMNHSAFGGFTDWRLPSRPELASILRHGAYLPALDRSKFPNIEGVWGHTWSSTTFSNLPTYAWKINLALGAIGVDNKLEPRLACAVRGQSPPAIHLVSNGDNTVTDTVNGLMWKADLSYGKYTWQEAFEYAGAVNRSRWRGYDDWRLPNINELQTLIISYNNLTIHPLMAPSTVPYIYWSSTTLVNGRTDPGGAWGAWGLQFATGHLSYFNKINKKYYVHLVRSTPSTGSRREPAAAINILLLNKE